MINLIKRIIYLIASEKIGIKEQAMPRKHLKYHDDLSLSE